MLQIVSAREDLPKWPSARRSFSSIVFEIPVTIRCITTTIFPFRALVLYNEVQPDIFALLDGILY